MEKAAAENRGQAQAAKKAAAEAGAALAAAKEKQAKLLSSPALRAPLLPGWEEVPLIQTLTPTLALALT